LTDYDRLAEFIPGMRRSRVLERRGASVIVEQSGEARFLFFAIPIEVTLATLEQPPRSIEASMLKGNLKRLHGTYRIEPRAGSRVLRARAGPIPHAAARRLSRTALLRRHDGGCSAAAAFRRDAHARGHRGPVPRH